MKQGFDDAYLRIQRVDIVALATRAGFESRECAFNLIGDPKDPRGFRGLADPQIHLMNELAHHIALAAIDGFSRLGHIAVRVRARCQHKRIPDGYDDRVGRCALQRGEGVDEARIDHAVDGGADSALVRGAVSRRTRPELRGKIGVVATDRDRDERCVAVARRLHGGKLGRHYVRRAGARTSCVDRRSIQTERQVGLQQIWPGLLAESTGYGFGVRTHTRGVTVSERDVPRVDERIE
jgi:hypothetical protein